MVFVALHSTSNPDSDYLPLLIISVSNSVVVALVNRLWHHHVNNSIGSQHSWAAPNLSVFVHVEHCRPGPNTHLVEGVCLPSPSEADGYPGTQTSVHDVLIDQSNLLAWMQNAKIILLRFYLKAYIFAVNVCDGTIFNKKCFRCS